MNDKKELFEGTAWYYARYRRGYPDSFFKHISKAFNLNSSSRVLDLGTGTGQIAIPSATRVKEVVAVDPEQEMLDEGRRIAYEKGIENITWVLSKAEEVPSTLGTFDVTTMGASFHWMDQDKALSIVHQLTNSGGGIVIVPNTSSIHRNKGNDAWKDVVAEKIKEYLGEKRRAGNSYYQEPKDRFEDVLVRSGFSRLQTFTDTYTQHWDIGSIVGFLGSTSFAARRLFGDRIQEFENELTDSLLQLNSSGKFTETAVLEALIGWK